MREGELKKCQEEFEAFLKEHHLNGEKDKDVWDQEIYKYPKIEAMWYAWKGCWSTRPLLLEEEAWTKKCVEHELGGLLLTVKDSLSKQDEANIEKYADLICTRFQPGISQEKELRECLEEMVGVAEGTLWSLPNMALEDSYPTLKKAIAKAKSLLNRGEKNGD